MANYVLPIRIGGQEKKNRIWMDTRVVHMSFSYSWFNNSIMLEEKRC